MNIVIFHSFLHVYQRVCLTQHSAFGISKRWRTGLWSTPRTACRAIPALQSPADVWKLEAKSMLLLPLTLKSCEFMWIHVNSCCSITVVSFDFFPILQKVALQRRMVGPTTSIRRLKSPGSKNGATGNISTSLSKDSNKHFQEVLPTSF